MIAVVGSRDLRIGFRLAGVKRTYKNTGELNDEKIVIFEGVNQKETVFAADDSRLLINVSLQKNIPRIDKKFIRHVMGANVLIK